MFVCMAVWNKLLKHQNTRKLYICLKTRMFGILHIWMFVYLKAGCSVFYIIWLISTEWMFAYIETCSFGYMFAIMYLCFFKFQIFETNKLYSNAFTYMFACLYARMLACLYACMVVCLCICITTSIISYYKFFNLLFCLKVWLLVCLLDNLKFHLMRIY